MHQVIQEKQTISDTQQNLKAYFETHDVKYIAEDAVFKNMSTGEETIGRDAIAGMLNFMYHADFNATAEIKNTIITEDKALLEANFKGRHIGEFGGIQATNNEVNVPLCVSYDLENGYIKYGRIYMLTDKLMQQLEK